VQVAVVQVAYLTTFLFNFLTDFLSVQITSLTFLFNLPNSNCLTEFVFKLLTLVFEVLPPTACCLLTKNTPIPNSTNIKLTDH
jgi:hypothetical protein